MRARTRGTIAVAAVCGMVAACFAAFAGASSAHAQAGTCLPYFNDADIAGNESHHAHPIDGTRDLDISIKSFAAIGTVTLVVEAGPWTRRYEAQEGPPRAGYTWSGRIPPSEFAPSGAGIYRVSLESTGGCQSISWIRITGVSAFDTSAGRAGFGAIAAGVALVGVAALFAWRRNVFGIFIVIAGGTIAGAGLTIVAWQAGRAALIPLSLVVWGTPPLLLGGGLIALISRVRGPAPEDEDDDLDDEGGLDDDDGSHEFDEDDDAVAAAPAGSTLPAPAAPSPAAAEPLPAPTPTATAEPPPAPGPAPVSPPSRPLPDDDDSREDYSAI